MKFDQLRLEVKYLLSTYKFQNNKSNLIKVFCSEVISNKIIVKVEMRFYTQIGRNPETVLLDWVEMDNLYAPIYSYILNPDGWTETSEGRIDVRITYYDNTIQLKTLDFKYTIED